MYKRQSEEGLPHIEQAHVRAKLLKQGKAFEELTAALADDLSWTASGLTSKVSAYVLSEPAYHSLLSTLLIVLYFATVSYTHLAL